MKATWLRAGAFLIVSGLQGQADAPSSDASQNVPVVPASLWKISASAGDRVQLGAVNDLLHITYDVAVRDRVLPGKMLKQAFFRIELQKPVPVTPDQMRLIFEARGQDGSAEARTGTVFIHPILADGSDERFYYEPDPVPLLKAGGGDDWARWTTEAFRISEGGGATPQIYRAEGGGDNCFPEGALEFIGFEVEVQKDVAGKLAGRRAGDLYLGNVALNGLRMKEGDPWAFADAFVKDKGRYKVAMEVAPAFQAMPVAETTQDISFDPADEASRRQRLTAPAGQLKNSWIHYRVTDASSKIIADGRLRWEIDIPPSPALPTVDLSAPPAVGLVRVNPQRDQGGVYAASEPVNLVVRAYAPQEGTGAPAGLKWTISSYAFPTVVQSGATSLSVPEGSFQEITLAPRLPEGQTAFRMHYSVLAADGNELDRGDYIFGISPGQVQPYLSRQGILPDRNRIKKYPYFHITYSDGGWRGPSAQAVVDRFAGFLDESSQMTNHDTYMVDLADLEVLPGVYDFSLLDQLMDQAWDHGCYLTIRLGHGEQVDPFIWQPYARPRNFDGTVIQGHPAYRAFSAADPDFIAAYQRGLKALHDRYQKHPAFEGYYLMQPDGEWVIPDDIWFGKMTGYDRASVDSFRQYLQRERGLTLAQLNARWGTQLASWDQVVPPLPSMELGPHPDLRPSWVDFSQFKLWLTDSWNTEMAGYIRTFDPTHLVIVYGRWTDVAFNKDLLPAVDYVHNGGNHVLDGEGMLTQAWKAGLGFITEPHDPHSWADYGDPVERGWVLDWSVFVMLAQAGGGGANLHVYYFPDPDYTLANEYGGVHAYDRFEQYKPILRELHGLSIADPSKQTAIIQDPDTVLLKHRTTYIWRMNDLGRWFDLLKLDSVDYEPFNPDHEQHYKLIVLNPLDEVVSGDTMAKVDHAVRSGAWLVMSACTGRYSPDQAAQQDYPLLKRLGIAAPSGTFVRNTPDVEARATAAGQDVLDRSTIPFYSQADMNRDLHDPAIAANYANWPYRFIPQTDYFGYYRHNLEVGGDVLARFPDGGVAVSSHPVGKGRVIVFWGTPSLDPGQMHGLLGALAKRAGVVDPRLGSSIPHVLEGDNQELGRHYALLYQQTAGTYVQKLTQVPDGTWFLDDMVSGERYGTYAGDYLRDRGIQLIYPSGAPPLKIIRMMRADRIHAPWLAKFPTHVEEGTTH